MRKLTQQEFEKKAHKKHNNQYDYGLSAYEGQAKKKKKKIVIVCSKHGPFYQTAGNHLVGKGCKVCSKYTNPSYSPKPVVDVIRDFQKVHSNKYTYLGILQYTNSHTAIEMLCNTTGQVFKQTPSNHLAGKGCPCCAFSGFDTSKPAILYYLSINDGQAYKVGITNRSVEERFSNTDLGKIKVLFTVEYLEGVHTLNEETRIKKEYTEFKYVGSALLKDGNTELFTKDILRKDTYEQ